MRILANGIDVYYEVRGQGPAMVMVHGNSEDHRFFDSCASVLEKHFTLYLPDSRGHGQSSPVEEFHYNDMAEDVACFIGALSLDKPILVGFSDGGIIGLTLAFTHPGILSRLVVCGANTRPETLGGFFGFRCRHSRKLRKDPKVIMMLEEPHITAEQLGSISVPTLVLAGGKDCIDPKDTDFIAASIPGSKKIIVKGEGHGTYIKGSTKLADIIMSEFGIQ